MFQTKWKSSKNPGKQIKYKSLAPAHIKGKFMHTHLSDELAKKYGKRSARVRKGDKILIIKGQFKGRTGKVEKVEVKRMKLLIEGIDIQKGDGTKVKLPITVSNVMIQELVDDKKRQEILKRK
ncbi:MAG: 50S ribosomal protein L24 [archaeon]